MDAKPIAVITSRAASKHFEDIKVKHADLVNGLRDQSLRVATLNQQKKLEQDTKNQQDTEQRMRQEQSDRESQNQERDYNMKLLEALKP